MNIYEFQEELRKKSKIVIVGSFFYTFLLMSLIIFFLGSFFLEFYHILTISIASSLLIVFPTFYYAYSRPISFSISILRARPINPLNKKEKLVYEIFDNLKIAYGIRNVELRVLPWNVINAMAASSKSENMIFITKGAIEKLDYYEIEAVLAHEFAHIKNKDSYYMTLISVVGMVSLVLAWFLMRVVPRILFEFAVGGREEKDKGSLILLGMALAAFILGVIFYLATPFIFLKLISNLSKKREYLADSTAVYVTKNPPAMIRVLVKVAYEDTSEFIEKMKIPKNINALLFDYEDFETHPKIWQRIEAICKTTNTPYPPEFEELKRRDI